MFSDFFKTIRVRNACDGIKNLYLEEPSIYCSDRSCEVDVSFTTYPQVDMRVKVEIDTYDGRGNRIGSEEESATSWSSSVDVEFSYLGDDVSKVVVTDVDCEKW